MRKLLTLLIFSMVATFAFAQERAADPTNLTHYKAVIKDASGNLMTNHTVQVRFTIFNGATGPQVFTETHNATTDAHGIVVLDMGSQNADWDDIDWGAALHYLKVEYDTGSGFVDLGTQPFRFVPYAQFAISAHSAANVNFSDINGTPTTLAGYGITDALQLDPADATTLPIVNSNSTGDSKAIDINVNGSGSGIHYGIKNELSGDGTGKQYATVNSVSNSGNATHYGSFNELNGSGSGIHIGTYNTIPGAGTGVQYATVNSVSNSGNASHFGSYNYLSGTGSGDKYGVYSRVNTAAGGTHYAVYAEAVKAGSYAGYFKGDVEVVGELHGNVSGDADMKAYVYGYVNDLGTLAYPSSTGYTSSKTATGKYKITFDDTSLTTMKYIVIAVATDNAIPKIITIDQNDGNFDVYIWNLSGTTVDSYFTFVVYKR